MIYKSTFVSLSSNLEAKLVDNSEWNCQMN